jgi:CRP-like cAMP-binding protein
MISQVVTYTCEKGQYIFKQSDPGSLFFIIKSGIVSI